MLDPARSYDLIGDVHGCALTLEHLLDRLGYRKQGGVWRHGSRQALFLGDIIDRGPRIRESLHIVHDMVVADQARCIMGNHEFNALGWSTPALPGSGKHYVREHVPRHERLIQATLDQFAQHPGDWHDFLGWFYELPLFLDAERFRLVHACWDAGLIEPLRRQHPDGCIDAHFLQASAVQGSFASQVFDRLLRGTDGAVGTPAYVNSYWVFDAMASYPINKNVDVRLNVYNLADKEYVAAINKSGYRYTPGTPRSASLTANWRF